MKVLSIIVCNLIVASAFAHELTDDPLRPEAIRLLSGDWMEGSKVDKNKKPALIAYLRREAALDDLNESMYDFTLLGLGDEMTLRKFIDKEDFNALRYTLDPHVFEMVAPVMFRNDEFEAKKVRFLLELPSFHAASTIGVMLREMPQVPKAVKDWMEQRTRWALDSFEARQLCRDWWMANREAWLRRVFASLKPGRDMSHKDAYKMVDELKARMDRENAQPAVSEEPPASTPAPAPVVQAQQRPPAAPATNQPPTTGWPAMALVAGGALLLAAGLLFLWKKARKMG